MAIYVPTNRKPLRVATGRRQCRWNEAHVSIRKSMPDCSAASHTIPPHAFSYCSFCIPSLFNAAHTRPGVSFHLRIPTRKFTEEQHHGLR